MSERYTRLFSLPENLYVQSSPVIIAAGALLKDNKTGRVLVQLKLRSIVSIKIKAVKVKIIPFDVVMRPLGGEAVYQYLDLDVCRDTEFGQKTPIILSEASARSFSASVDEVAFMDNSVWNSSKEDWRALPVPSLLIEELGDIELVKQYRLETNTDGFTCPAEFEDLWQCVCGTYNYMDEPMCHRCGHSLEELQKALNLDNLVRLKELRLAEEKQLLIEKRAADEKAAQEKAAVEKARIRKRKKVIVVSAITVCFIIAAVIIINRVVVPSVKNDRAYKEACMLMEEGKYSEAQEAFLALDGYKDAEEQAENAHISQLEEEYDRAKAFYDKGQYIEARKAFLELGNYKDSARAAEEAETAGKEEKYNNAKKMSEAGNYAEAHEIFLELNDYKNSAEEAELAQKGMDYDKALSLCGEGNFVEAQQLLLSLGDYKDAEKLAYGKDFLQVGCHVQFGHYEQDNDLNNGPEIIEWRILDRDHDKIFVISEYVLDFKQIDSVYHEIEYWGNSTLRSWLNQDFLDVAFADYEKEMILSVSVKNQVNRGYVTEAGENTTDKLFLLSVDEAKKYFLTKEERISKATAYTNKQGMYPYSDGSCLWWLRSPINVGYVYVSADGSIYERGTYSRSTSGVRPALWIDLNQFSGM
ncbi:DUF6273 domain-containing protein [Qiania dongpingensis]|uniref:DUF6273 domain-containing protein n=1 Tax=Qiania dongpingensis TaxID=2763669 RepID=A0A7G9G7D5_9FIRM|nr:DUF6273 domain-containing protein [Qiania dongpingensis]QNM06717.1 hypothetical protein H9Q78_06275 [Qiania dongpingensis]